MSDYQTGAEAIQDAADKVTGAIDDTAETAADKVLDAADKASAFVAEAGARAQEAYRSAAGRAQDVADTIDPFVQERPYLAVAIAAGIGLVVGLLLAGNGPKIIYVDGYRD
jgi:ElaB/YqjD/DUF883 family membrane-anchored ribosome-binding protein